MRPKSIWTKTSDATSLLFDSKSWPVVDLSSSLQTELIRRDLFDVLDHLPNEVAGLLAALRNGEIHGQFYNATGGGCLMGTLCKLHSPDKLPELSAAIWNVSGEDIGFDGIVVTPVRPAERLFGNINPPDNRPRDSAYAAHAEKLILEWQTDRYELALYAWQLEQQMGRLTKLEQQLQSITTILIGGTK